jgi:Ras-related GTP-binding protein A/B
LYASDVEHTHVRFLGNLVLNLWDCGGQYRFYESYFDSQRDTIFRNVEVLIYVFDIDSGDVDNDITLFDGVLEALEQNSPDAKIFVLIHKMDLITDDLREKTFLDREAAIKGRSQQ